MIQSIPFSFFFSTIPDDGISNLFGKIPINDSDGFKSLPFSSTQPPTRTRRLFLRHHPSIKKGETLIKSIASCLGPKTVRMASFADLLQNLIRDRINFFTCSSNSKRRVVRPHRLIRAMEINSDEQILLPNLCVWFDGLALFYHFLFSLLSGVRQTFISLLLKAINQTESERMRRSFLIAFASRNFERARDRGIITLINPLRLDTLPRSGKGVQRPRFSIIDTSWAPWEKTNIPKTTPSIKSQ